MFAFACKRFLGGLMTGILSASVIGLAVLYTLNSTGIAVFYLPEALGVNQFLNYTYDNLRLSVIPFMILLLCYVYLILKLQRLLTEQAPELTLITHTEQLLDNCITLFFGVGVLFTAIGMRSALMFAIGNPEAAAADGAFTMLQRMVDGGILLSLSTTIVGGIGGYLMRILKSLMVGQKIQFYYQNQINHEQERGQQTLLRIEHYLQQLLECETQR